MTDQRKKRPSSLGYGIGATLGGAAGAATFAASGQIDRKAKSFADQYERAKAMAPSDDMKVSVKRGKTNRIGRSWIDQEDSRPKQVSAKLQSQIKSVKQAAHAKTFGKALADEKSGILSRTVKRFKAAQALGKKEVSKKISDLVRNNPVKLALGGALLGGAFLGGAMQKEANVKLQVKSFSKTAALDFSGIRNAIKATAEGIGKRIPGKAGELARAEVTHLSGAVSGAIKAVPKVDPSNPLGIIKTYKPQAKVPLTGLSTLKS